MAGQSTFWVPHDEAVFLPGKGLAGGNEFDCGEMFGKVTVKDPKALEEITDEDVLKGVEDCCTLNNVTPAAILHTCRERFMRDEIYTNVSTVLIALNPFKSLPIYDKDNLDKYRTAEDHTALPPHIFGVCANAFEGIEQHRNNQAVLVSGESGAGKTETTKIVLLYTSEALAGQDGGLEDQVLEVNPILEAFGNAKTTRNNNSSRFGKWIEVQMDAGKRTLNGVSIVDYLLEVTRVTGQGPQERNYHVFYQLCADPVTKEKLKLFDAPNMTYLKANPMELDGVDDGKELVLLQKALHSLNFDKEEEDGIFKIVASVLHIGNVELKGDDNAEIANDAAETAAGLLEVDKELLAKCICFKRITTGRDTVESPLDKDKARVSRDSIAKMLFGRLFKWLVVKCNESLGASLGTGASSKSGNFLGVLDIAGFESFEKNMLEQLLINLSNEKLQQFFNNMVFKQELAEYEAEGITIKIDFQDNAEVLALIEAKDGILAILDDSTTGVRQTDQTFTSKLSKEKEKHARFIKSKFTNSNVFGVKHYAGDVTYTTDGFLEKNNSVQPPEVLEMMASSKLSVLVEVSKDPEEPAADAAPAKPGPKAGGAKKKATVGSSFKISLNKLMEKLGQASCHFIRCIKPNMAKKPNLVDSKMIMNQLKLCGVMETVEIRKAGFSVRPKCKEFVARYLIILPKDVRANVLKAAGSKKDNLLTDDANAEVAAKELLKAIEAPEGSSALGKTKVFLKGTLQRTLEDKRAKAFIPCAVKIQAAWRGFSTRKSMVEVKEIHKNMQKCLEGAGKALGESDFKPTTIDRATLADHTLGHFDMVMTQAQKCSIKLPYLSEADKVHAHWKAKTVLARKMQNMTDSIDITDMDEVVAQAANYKMEGKVVDNIKARIDVVKAHQQVKRDLTGTLDNEDLTEVQAAVAKAQEQGFDKADKWVLPDGMEAYNKAVARKEEMEEEVRKAEAAKAAFIQSLTDACSSTDIDDIQRLLLEAGDKGIDVEAVGKLRERVDTLNKQADVAKSLSNALQSDELDAVERILDKAKEAGLDSADKWIFPDGPGALEKAKAHHDKLAAAKAGADKEASDLAEALKAAANTSEDVDAMQSLLAKAAAAGNIDAALIADLAKRCGAVEEQIPMKQSLHDCALSSKIEEVNSVIEKAAAQGLDDAAKWCVSGGADSMKKAKARAQALKNIGTVMENIKAAAAKCDCDKLAGLIKEASDLGVDPKDYETEAALLTSLQDAKNVEQMAASAAGDEEKTANLQKQVEVLKPADDGEGQQNKMEAELKEAATSCDIQALNMLLARASASNVSGADFDAVKARCQKLETQLPHMQALTSAIASNNVEKLTKTLDEVKAAGLGEASNWVDPKGAQMLDGAVTKLKWEEGQKNKSQDLGEQLKDVATSSNLPSMQVILERAIAKGMTGADVDAAKERIKKVQKQQPYVRQLRNCAAYDDAEKVKEIIDRVTKEVGEWVLPEGPKQMEAANQRLAELKADESKDRGAVLAIEAKMRGLSDSLDLPALQGVLTQAKEFEDQIKRELLVKLNKRTQQLVTQTPLLRALKNCKVYESIDEVRQVLQQVQKADLDDKDSWLLPDGYKFYERAQQREKWLVRCDALKERMQAACTVYDAKALKQSFHTAADMEMPSNVYANEKKMFVDLQSSEFVLAKLETLRKSGETDETTLLATANLDEQLKALGVSTGNDFKKAAARRMSRMRSRAKSSWWDAGEASEVVLAGKYFDDLANYGALRDSTTFDLHSHEPGEGGSAEDRVRAMLRYTPERITNSLTKIDDKQTCLSAKNNFGDLLRCMGDKPAPFVADKEAPILKRVKGDNDQLRDEVYLQVLKQLTDNPSNDSTERGWVLLEHMVEIELPGAELSEFFRAFLQKEAGQNKAKDAARSVAAEAAKMAAKKARQARDEAMLKEDEEEEFARELREAGRKAANEAAKRAMAELAMKKMAAQRRGEGVEEKKAPAPADETKPKPKWGGGINLASDSGTPLGGGGLASRMAAFQKKDVTRAGFGMGGNMEKKEAKDLPADPEELRTQLKHSGLKNQLLIRGMDDRGMAADLAKRLHEQLEKERAEAAAKAEKDAASGAAKEDEKKDDVPTGPLQGTLKFGQIAKLGAAASRAKQNVSRNVDTAAFNALANVATAAAKAADKRNASRPDEMALRSLEFVAKSAAEAASKKALSKPDQEAIKALSHVSMLAAEAAAKKRSGKEADTPGESALTNLANIAQAAAVRAKEKKDAKGDGPSAQSLEALASVARMAAEAGDAKVKKKPEAGQLGILAMVASAAAESANAKATLYQRPEESSMSMLAKMAKDAADAAEAKAKNKGTPDEASLTALKQVANFAAQAAACKREKPSEGSLSALAGIAGAAASAAQKKQEEKHEASPDEAALSALSLVAKAAADAAACKREKPDEQGLSMIQMVAKAAAEAAEKKDNSKPDQAALGLLAQVAAAAANQAAVNRPKPGEEGLGVLAMVANAAAEMAEKKKADKSGGPDMATLSVLASISQAAAQAAEVKRVKPNQEQMAGLSALAQAAADKSNKRDEARSGPGEEVLTGLAAIAANAAKKAKAKEDAKADGPGSDALSLLSSVAAAAAAKAEITRAKPEQDQLGMLASVAAAAAAKAEKASGDKAAQKDEDAPTNDMLSVLAEVAKAAKSSASKRNETRPDQFTMSALQSAAAAAAAAAQAKQETKADAPDASSLNILAEIAKMAEKAANDKKAKKIAEGKPGDEQINVLAMVAAAAAEKAKDKSTSKPDEQKLSALALVAKAAAEAAEAREEERAESRPEEDSLNSLSLVAAAAAQEAKKKAIEKARSGPNDSALSALALVASAAADAAAQKRSAAPDQDVLSNLADMARAAADAAKAKKEGDGARPDTEALESLASIAAAAAAAAATKRERRPSHKKLEGLKFVADAAAAAALAWQQENDDDDELTEEDIAAMKKRRKSRIATVELRDPAYIAKRAAFRAKKEELATRILEKFVARCQGKVLDEYYKDSHFYKIKD